jgi:branched-chain amino acid transport system substrate-binding protein
MRNTGLVRWIAAGLAILGIGLMVPAVRGESTTVKIVSSLPRVGPGAPETTSIEKAIRLALEETNHQVGDFTVVYEALDDAPAAVSTWDPRREAEIATQAVGDPDVMAYIGPFNSGAARVALPILNRAHMVAVSPTASYPGLTKTTGDAIADEPNVYSPTGVRSFARIIPPDDQQAAIGASWAAQLGVSRAAIVDDGSPRGRRLSAAFVAAARQLKIDIVSGPQSLDRKAADYGVLADQIRTSGPELVYFAGSTQNHASQFVKEARAVLGADVAIMATDRIYNQSFLDQVGKDGEGIYVTVNGLPPGKLTDRGAAWYAAYRARYQEEPGLYSVYGYEAARVLLAAISHAGVKDREAIRAEVLATTHFDGLLGSFAFDPHGDPTLIEMSGRQVINNQFDDPRAVILTLPAPAPRD